MFVLGLNTLLYKLGAQENTRAGVFSLIKLQTVKKETLAQVLSFSHITPPVTAYR